jgi:hypothetical protein
VLALSRAAIQWAVLALGAAPSSQLLFTLGRTTNANVVEYSARLDGDGLLARQSPFDVSWRMLARDGHREGLSFFEQQLAYGLSSRTLVDRESYELKLVSCPERKILVRRATEGYEAETRIGGQPSRLLRIFVRTAEGGLSPRVLAVELSGVSLRDGRTTFEVIVPQRSGDEIGER